MSSQNDISRDMAATGLAEEQFKPIFDRLESRFTREQLGEAIAAVRAGTAVVGILEEIADSLISLTRVNHQLHLPHQPPVFREVEIVIFPFSELERHGIEDLRLVHLRGIRREPHVLRNVHCLRRRTRFPQIFQYAGGDTIDVNLITGKCAKNKDMALFPGVSMADSR